MITKEQRISASEEHRLTRAIETAATIASVNEGLDRSKLLADNLKKEGIHHKFAKTASDAFNKRLTVLRFQATDDAHKPDAFELSDSAAVAGMLGKEAELDKTASVQSLPFVIGFTPTAAPMQKTASVHAYKRPNYEDVVDYKVLMSHIESVIDKQAARVQHWSDTVTTLENKLERDTKELAEYFQKSACSTYEFSTLNNVYGAQFKEAFKNYLPETTDFSKTASVAILPKGPVYTKVAEVLETTETIGNLKDFMGSYAEGLTEFCGTASKVARVIADCEYKGLVKKAAPFAPIFGNVLRTGVMTGGLVGRGVADAASKANEASGAAFDNAKGMYAAGRDKDFSAGKALDSEFLVKDRFRDRMMAWSDMTADPLFAMYPSEQVFQATQKAMDFDTSMERPDRRETLRTQIAQLLAQNNRYSTADIAAQAATLKAIAAGKGSASQIASEGVGALSPVEKVEAPELKAMIAPAEKSTKDLVAPYVAESAKAWDDYRKARLDSAKEDRELSKEEEAAFLEEQKAFDKDLADKIQAIKDAQDAKDLQDAANAAAAQKAIDDRQAAAQLAADNRNAQGLAAAMQRIHEGRLATNALAVERQKIDANKELAQSNKDLLQALLAKN